MAVTECTFCQRSVPPARTLIGGPDGTAICEGCVALCVDALREQGIELPSVELDTAAVIGPPSGGWTGKVTTVRRPSASI